MPFQTPVVIVPKVFIDACPIYEDEISNTFVPLIVKRLVVPVNATAPVNPFTDCTLVDAG